MNIFHLNIYFSISIFLRGKLKNLPIVGMDNGIDYSECTRNVPKFSYNIMNKVFFGLSLNMKYLCKYFFGIRQLRITLLLNEIL